MDRVAAVALFIRIVETGSFSKAAAEFGITQPTATKAVAAMEQRLGARLLHRTTRGVSPDRGRQSLYYDKCKAIAHEIEAADNLATLMQSGVGGTLRISTSVAFGRRVLVPLSIAYMREHPGLTVDLGFDDRYVNMVEQGIDLAIRMGRLADSTLGSRYLGRNPWVMVAAPAYLKARGYPAQAAELSQHACLIYSTVQGDDRWMITGPDGREIRRCRCAGRCDRTTCRPCSLPRARAWASPSCPGTWHASRWPMGRCSRSSSATPCRRRKSTPCSLRPSWCRAR